MTTVTESLDLGSGSDATGVTVVFQLVGAGGSPLREAYFDDTTIVGEVEATVTNGAYSQVLAPNGAITPSDTAWKRTVTVPGSGSTSVFITVPASGTVAVDDILTDAPAAIETGALAAHIAKATGAHAASAISCDVVGLDSIDVNSALAEILDEAGGGAPSGPAGGVLAGTYPNPSFSADMATQAELDAVQAAAVMDGDSAGGDLSGTYPNPTLVAESVQDIVGGMFSGNSESGITATYDDTNGKIDLAVAADAPVAYHHHFPFSRPGTDGDDDFTVNDTDGGAEEAVGTYAQTLSTSAGNGRGWANLPMAAGTWRVSAYIPRNASYGRLHVLIDGNDTGTYIDGYNAALDYKEYAIGNQDFTVAADGLHTIRLQVNSRNASNSTGYNFLYYWIDLQRVSS